MSLLRTFQNQARIVTLFTHISERPNTLSISKALKESDAPTKFMIQVAREFPTLDQLKYMREINSGLLGMQVINAEDIMAKPSFDPVFRSSLSECVKKGIWNNNTGIWVDWEKKLMGKYLVHGQ
ncbi:HBR215Cp [Eremothecium sinecaudum]|uniref:HBR215Cp n=1 Tax=Eremothecium sinecaudum TaxID=45286 RepID=A0A125RE11_9SACH|nr:HBR215Cp [Eremothecium sinecaudum]AMD19116.1 HBR215Cp [Eremothecium sinecaudum]